MAHGRSALQAQAAGRAITLQRTKMVTIKGTEVLPWGHDDVKHWNTCPREVVVPADTQGQAVGALSSDEAVGSSEGIWTRRLLNSSMIHLCGLRSCFHISSMILKHM